MLDVGAPPALPPRPESTAAPQNVSDVPPPLLISSRVRSIPRPRHDAFPGVYEMERGSTIMGLTSLTGLCRMHI